MKFAEHLVAHITPEWRRQYIVYEEMKTLLYEAIENMPTLETTDPQEIERLTKAFDEDFLGFCEKELFKINVFYEEKLAEAKRKFDTLRKEMDALVLEYQNSQRDRQKSDGLFRSSIGKLVGSKSARTDDAAHRFGASPASMALRHRHSPTIQPQTAAQMLGSASHRGSVQSIRPPANSPSLPSAHATTTISTTTTTMTTTPPVATPPTSATTVMFAPAKADSSSLLTKHQPTHHRSYGTLNPNIAGIDRKKLQDLKLAFSEFYLSLVLLQNYQRLNFEGFRKILKKHDKLIGNEDGKRWHHANVESAFFHTNKDVDKLIEDTENIVTYHLESGDRQKAMKRLRVPPLNDAPQPWTAFRVGFSLGAFVVLAIAVALTGIFHQTGEEWFIVFRLYRSSLFIIFFIFLVGINIYVWRAHGVNHVLIFELDPRDHLSSQDLLEISFEFGLLWCISVLLFLWSEPLGIPPLLNPMILNGVMLIYLFNPTKTLHYNARTWLMSCIVSRLALTDLCISSLNIINMTPLCNRYQSSELSQAHFTECDSVISGSPTRRTVWCLSCSIWSTRHVSISHRTISMAMLVSILLILNPL